MSYRRKEIIGDCTLYLGDCKEVMPTLGRVCAAVMDPPYGIGEDGRRQAQLKSRSKIAASNLYAPKNWDSETQQGAVQQAIAMADHAIVFGGNYYDLPPSRCWLVWDKDGPDNHFADCELAWTNLNKAVRRVRYLWNGCMRRERDIERVHPTQKPVGVMDWCLGHLPPNTEAVLDPFMGSGTTGVACVRRGLSFVGIELDEEYFDFSCERIAEAYQQPELFEAEVFDAVENGELFGGDDK
ncbi:MAG: DNA methyltransferase [Henriciella sp.]|nr:DNA methyltransferase [Henriciella sp.]